MVKLRVGAVINTRMHLTMPTPITVIITPAGRNNPLRTANRFVAALADGTLSEFAKLTPLVTRPTVAVERAACRALVARGQPDGPVEFVHRGSAVVSLRFRSIHAAARFTIDDGDQFGPRVVRFREYSEGLTELRKGSEDDAHTAALVEGCPCTGECEMPAQRRPSTQQTHVYAGGIV